MAAGWAKSAEVAPHIALARWAEVVVVYPATATTISRLARGDCSTIVAALAVSARCPVIVVTAMNVDMWRAPSVQRNLRRARRDGFYVTQPVFGREVAEVPETPPTFGAAMPVWHVAELVDRIVARAAPA